jgi:DNA modification methylase
MKQKVKIGDVIPNEKNPRYIRDPKFNKLVTSIKEFPQMLEKRPIVVDENMIVLGGNMRLNACKKAGLKEVWIDVAEGWSEKQKSEFIIKDNVGFGEWDWEILANEWDMKELSDWGMDLPEDFFDEEILEAEEDDYTEPDNLKVDVVLGDLIEIGEHRLLCGDSTDSDQVAKLMNGQKADMVFTDPPYLGEMGSGGFSKDLKLQKSKDKKIDEIRSIYNFDPTKTFPIIELIKKKVTNIFLFCNKNLVPKYLNYALETNRLFDILTWHKTSFIPANNNTYYPDTEYLIKIKDKGAFFKTGLGNSVNYGKYWILNNKDKESHPTVKPQEIIKDCFLICSKENDLIVDLFLGSGSTMVASHQLKRKCYGMELEPKYCQVIIDRMQKLEPNIEIKINGKEYKNDNVL